jgi:hypothetical protein
MDFLLEKSLILLCAILWYIINLLSRQINNITSLDFDIKIRTRFAKYPFSLKKRPAPPSRQQLSPPLLLIRKRQFLFAANTNHANPSVLANLN